MSTDKISAEDAEHLAAYNRVYLALDPEDRARERKRREQLENDGRVMTIADELHDFYPLFDEHTIMLARIANNLVDIATNLSYLQ